MSMDVSTFLTRIIDDGIAAARADYANKPEKRDGAVYGFELCRGKAPSEILALYTHAQHEVMLARERRGDDFWRYRCCEAEIEWVLNCLSAALQVSLLAWLPTARGFMKAAEVLGVDGS